MRSRSEKRLGFWAAAIVCGFAGILCPASTAEAGDFFSALFDTFGGGQPHAPALPLPFANEGNGRPAVPQGQTRSRYAGGQAYCVRSCDGRYFPIVGSDNESRAASCNSFCPASETRVV